MSLVTCLDSVRNVTYCRSRLMIIVFTSTAFTDWVKDHVEAEANTVFNPYLTFLFYALYVLSVLDVAKHSAYGSSSRAAMSLIRFTGSTLYLVLRLIGH